MKSGLEYFPLDVHLDEKFDLIEAEFGLTGFSVVVKLFQRIYGGEGYYCEWTREVALLFARQVGLGGSAVSEIIEAAIKRGIFDKDLFEKYQILTSAGIQKRYFEAVVRRKQVEVKSAYLLLCNSQIPKNVYISGENVNISSKNADISKQSKVKESKVKKRESLQRGAGAAQTQQKGKSAAKSQRADDGCLPMPSLDDVKNFYKSEGLRGNPERFFHLYDARDWQDDHGNRVRNWKALARYWSAGEREDLKRAPATVQPESDPTYDLDSWEDMMRDYVPVKK